MSLTLFHTAGSPPSRTALLTLRNLGLDVEIKNVDIMGGETRTAEYKKLK